MSKEYKLDVFETLSAIDRRDGDFLQRQPEEARKAFSPRVVLRWASSVNGPMAEYYIEATNQIVNVEMDAISDHPELQYRLMAMVGVGKPLRHNWIAMPKTKIKSPTKLHDFLAQWHPLASSKELDQLLRMHTRDDFAQLLIDAAIDTKDSKELMNAFDQSRGIEIPKAKGKKKKG